MRKIIQEHKYRKRIESLVNQGFDRELAEEIANEERKSATDSLHKKGEEK